MGVLVKGHKQLPLTNLLVGEQGCLLPCGMNAREVTYVGKMTEVKCVYIYLF